MKSLIINADDVGLSDAINAGVKECYRANAITGVSIMACGGWFQDACTMLREIGKVETGVHLTLTGRFFPCTDPPQTVGTLLDDRGTFVRNYREFLFFYFQKRLSPEQIYRELASQIKRVIDEGLKVTHLDSHEHIHMLPGILNITSRLAGEFGIPYIRLSLESPVVIRKRFSVKDFLRHTGLRVFGARAKGIISRTRLICNDIFLGHFHSGRIDDDTLLFMMENLPEGVSELAVHPAILSKELLEESPWHRNAQKEMDALITGRWRRYVNNGKVHLVSHAEVTY